MPKRKRLEVWKVVEKRARPPNEPRKRERREKDPGQWEREREQWMELIKHLRMPSSLNRRQVVIVDWFLVVYTLVVTSVLLLLGLDAFEVVVLEEATIRILEKMLLPLGIGFLLVMKRMF